MSVTTAGPTAIRGISDVVPGPTRADPARAELQEAASTNKGVNARKPRVAYGDSHLTCEWHIHVYSTRGTPPCKRRLATGSEPHWTAFCTHELSPANSYSRNSV